MTKRLLAAFLVALTGTLVLAAVGSGGTSKKQASPLPASSCSPLVYKGSGTREVPYRLRPPAAGLGADADDPDDEGDPVRPERGRLEGRELHDRAISPVTTRPPRPASGTRPSAPRTAMPTRGTRT